MNIALVGAECEENLALRYIRAALEARGHSVTQITFNAEADTEAAAECLARSDAGLAGFSMVFTYRAAEFAALARRCRELGFRGHLVAGGHFAAFNAEALLRDVPAFDSVAIGEGEELMCALAERLDSLSAVRGLIWRNGGGAVRRNAPAVKPPDLDRLPLPTRLEPPDSYLGLPVANMLGSRGCTHACAFCSIAAWHRLCGGARLRLREPAAIAEEMAGLYARGYRIFNFHDDNFFLPDRRQSLRRFWRLRGELQARGVDRIAFAVKSRPDTVDEETFAFLKEFGLFRVFLGIEAGTADSLRRLGRGQTPGQNERALEIVNRLDLHACFNLLLLNPESTLEDFRANVAFLRGHCGNPMNFCRTEIYAGTPLELKLRREGRLLGDYWGYGYRIRDERAQEAFELMYVGLAGRHFGDNCVHHLTMRVDFERQVLDHFWGCPAPLRRRAKDFVRRVNTNSCDYLEEIADAAAGGFGGAADRNEFLRRLAARVRRDNERFAAEANGLVNRISRTSQPVARRSGMWQQDAAAVLVSSLTLAATTSRSQNTHMTEAVARPPSSFTTQMVVDPPPPPIVNLANRQKAILQEKLLPDLAALLPAPAPLRVRVVLGDRGQWNSGEVFNIAANQSVAIPPEILRQLMIPELKSTICEATFSKEEVSQARTTPTAARAILKRELGKPVASALLADLTRAFDVNLELAVSKDGKIGKVSVTRLLSGHEPTVVTNIVHTRATLASVQIKEPMVRAKTWTVHYTAGELIEASPPTQYFEMAPHPPRTNLQPPPDTHMTEMTPVPRQNK
jgi:anaerobic magnesium-protoporphyrin IX monomethyl ester cyclase